MMIESPQNEKIKHLIRLISDNRFRKKAGVFVVEGKQENQRALEFTYQNKEYFICEEIFQSTLPDGKINLVSNKIYEKIAYRGSSEGIIGVYEVKNFELKDFQPSENASFIILEGVEKPGNLGAIIRSCEAFGISAVVITDSKTDFYNPNVIRSSVGCLFGINFFNSTNPELLDYLEKHHFKIYSTYMDEKSLEIQKLDLKQKSALIFGTEHSGIGDFWKDKAENFLIPMAGTIDSLNLSNAVAISCYEILQQKKRT